MLSFQLKMYTGPQWPPAHWSTVARPLWTSVQVATVDRHIRRDRITYMQKMAANTTKPFGSVHTEVYKAV